jgi:hypothetical protein
MHNQGAKKKEKEKEKKERKKTEKTVRLAGYQSDFVPWKES